MSTNTLSLGEAFPAEIARVQELLFFYQEIGRAGAFALANLSKVLVAATAAQAAGDTAAMVQIYPELKACE